MKTIYMYDDNISNLIVFIILLIAVILVLIALIIFFPLLNQSFIMVKTVINNSVKNLSIGFKKTEVLSITLTTIIIYSVLIIGLVFSTRTLMATKFRWIKTDVDLCYSVTGEIEDFNYEIIWDRYGDEYNCSFEVSGKKFDNFYIPVSQSDTIAYLSQKNNCVIYYQEHQNIVTVIRIDVQKTVDG